MSRMEILLSQNMIMFCFRFILAVVLIVFSFLLFTCFFALEFGCREEQDSFISIKSLLLSIGSCHLLPPFASFSFSVKQSLLCLAFMGTVKMFIVVIVLLFLPFVCVYVVCVGMCVWMPAFEYCLPHLSLSKYWETFVGFNSFFRLRSFIKHFSEFFLFKLFVKVGSKFEQKYVLLNFITLLL